MKIDIKELLKFRKKRLDAKPSRIEKSKVVYDRKNKKWKDDNDAR